MRVHHLDCGTTRSPGGGLLGTLHRAAPLVCHALLVEADDLLVLVDTGVCHRAADEVRALGVDPRDVRHVVLTSLDRDHAGGLADFPDAAVHVLAAEHAAATRQRSRLTRRRYRARDWAHGPAWRLHGAGGDRWFGFACARELPGIPDDVLLVPLPGPSAGHCGVAVRSDDGWLLHAGDAYLLRDEVHGAEPSCPAALSLARQLTDADPAARIANRERLRVLASDPDADVLVFASHDPLDLERCLERNPSRPCDRAPRVAWRPQLLVTEAPLRP